ncbi:MAG: DNA gyrase subunit A [Defluviitaleaceae bacterium]|nr:DNA gyrase subunit A [Defluviitaleaceae bacterium]
MNENEISKIKDIKLEDEVKNSFINYAMSVIAARALPDVRDGLKPVHRRILFAMEELGLDPSKGYKKSARITGDTMGKYHPHGNMAIYDAMVRMAQDFSLRYPLVDGHGNFGSIDGDSAAAERYTEAKLSQISSFMLEDIDKNTVDFVPNYNEEFLEPSVLPAKFPNLLVNGATGIAVGMTTNIPPHNLREIVDGVVKIIDNNMQEVDTSIDELINIIPGPDFPTGANILGISGIKSAYRTGRGSITVRSKTSIEEMKNGRQMIVITEIPYMVNKAAMVERIGELIRDKKIDGISDLRDESNRHGIRVVIELKKDINANVVLNNLYKFSQLQNTFSVNMLALVNKEPKTLNLKEVLVYYIEHQIEVLVRRTKFDLEKADKRLHIIEGLLIALDSIDEVIAIIRGSKDTSIAKQSLISKFNLTDIQATAIIDMRLRALTGLERERLEKEHNELLELVSYLKSILDNKNKQYEILKEEILKIKSKFSDDRRTSILPHEEEISIEDLIDDEMCVITTTHQGYIKRLPLETYKSQNRGGKGVIGMQTREEDLVKNIFVTNTHSFLVYFTNKGRVFVNKVYEVPEFSRNAKGVAIVNQINLAPNEKVATLITVKEFKEGDYFVMVTKNGIIKKIKTESFKNTNKSGKRGLTLKDEDEIISVLEAFEDSSVFVATKQGMGIMFSLTDVRATGVIAAGVKSIKLKQDDIVVGAEVLKEDSNILFVSEQGFGKTTKIGAFRTQSRGGTGLKIYKITEKTGRLVGICQANSEDEIMLINSSGIIIRLKISDISVQSRVTQGVKLINLNENETVVSMAKISTDKIDEPYSETNNEINN